MLKSSKRIREDFQRMRNIRNRLYEVERVLFLMRKELISDSTIDNLVEQWEKSIDDYPKLKEITKQIQERWFQIRWMK